MTAFTTCALAGSQRTCNPAAAANPHRLSAHRSAFVAPAVRPAVAPFSFSGASQPRTSSARVRRTFQPAQMSYQLHVEQSGAAISDALAPFIVDYCKKAVAERGAVTAAISGGSLPKLFAATLGKAPWKDQVDWSKWHLFWADERCVPLDHPDSNYLLVKQQLLDVVGIPASQVYAVKTELPPAEAATAYEAAVRGCAPLWKEGGALPRFDLMLLGMGPDGHTASLFPGHALLQESTKLVAPIFDSPKPPPSRVTLTLPVLNASRVVAFVSTGAEKADVLEKILEDDAADPTTVPSKLVKPTAGALHWFIDTGAASKLKRK